MPPKQRTQTRTIGKKPHVGRRYVSDGKVRIEWREGGKRRSRTVGPNTAKVRAQADEMLEALVNPGRASEQRQSKRASPRQKRLSAGEQGAESPVGDAIRAWAVALMDVADILVERAKGWSSQWTEEEEKADDNDG